MGNRRKQALRVQLDGKLKPGFHGVKITSDACLLAFRDLDEAFRLTEKGSTGLSDQERLYRRGMGRDKARGYDIQRDQELPLDYCRACARCRINRRCA